MADVFLSYARASAREAVRIADELRARGFSVWFDDQLPAHRAYSDVIEEQLEAASAVLVLWSAEAVSSQWVRSEANRARESGRLVQLRLDDARLPMPFDQIQCADLRDVRGDDSPAWQSVLDSIAGLTGKPSRNDFHGSRSVASKPRDINRRQLMIAGGTVAAVTAAGGAAWYSLTKPRVSPEAELLIQKGTDALQANDAFDPNDPAAAAQAIAILSDATRMAPDSATAWGGLALAYAVRKKGAPPAERAGFASRSRSAAIHALELDAREPRALSALRMLDPVYRNWFAAERADRQVLKIQPRLPILLFLLADMLGSVGRWAEAATLSRKFDRKKFLIAGADRQVVINLWSAGDLPGADDALRVAVEHWPQHPQIWRTRIAYLMYSGRLIEALRILHDNAEQPPEVAPAYVSAIEATIDALGARSDIAAAVRKNLSYLESNGSAVFTVVHALAALGAVPNLLAILNGYYFGVGQWARVQPAGGDEDRLTSPLFQPPMRRVWMDRGFGHLLESIGLNDYWRRSGTLPDYRKPT